MARRKSLLGKIFWRLLFNGVLIFIFCFMVLFGYQFFLEKTIKPANAEEASPLVVLGAQVKPDGTPSVQLSLRLDTAFEVYSKKARLIVVTGAQGKDEPEPEAQVMKRYLVQKGVKNEDILVDDTSINTIENLKNAMKLLPKDTKKISIITSDYHLPRALRIAKDLGIEADGYPSPTNPEFWLKNHTRETLAWGKYFLNKLLNLNNPQ